jgi:hypothetical protein
MSAARGIFAKEVLMPALLGLLLLAGLECLVRSDAVVAYIDRNQPISAGISPRFHVERQLWHLEALARRDVDRVAIVGSSSVVNGIDEAEIVAQLAQAGYPLQPQNLGLMVLLGYELPLLKQLLLTPRTKRIVYLYNLSSFSAEFHPEAIHSRWDLGEALRLQPVSAWDTATLSSLADRTATNSFYLTRFRRFLKEFAARADGHAGAASPPLRLRTHRARAARRAAARDGAAGTAECGNVLDAHGLPRFDQASRQHQLPRPRALLRAGARGQGRPGVRAGGRARLQPFQ